MTLDFDGHCQDCGDQLEVNIMKNNVEVCEKADIINHSVEVSSLQLCLTHQILTIISHTLLPQVIYPIDDL